MPFFVTCDYSTCYVYGCSIQHRHRITPHWSHKKRFSFNKCFDKFHSCTEQKNHRLFWGIKTSRFSRSEYDHESLKTYKQKIYLFRLAAANTTCEHREMEENVEDWIKTHSFFLLLWVFIALDYGTHKRVEVRMCSHFSLV